MMPRDSFKGENLANATSRQQSEKLPIHGKGLLTIYLIHAFYLRKKEQAITFETSQQT